MEATTHVLDRSTPEPPEKISIDPDAFYKEGALAGLFGVTPRTVRRWRETLRGSHRFPAPFYLGNKPVWRGKVLQIWLNNRQQEAQS